MFAQPDKMLQIGYNKLLCKSRIYAHKGDSPLWAKIERVRYSDSYALSIAGMNPNKCIRQTRLGTWEY